MGTRHAGTGSARLVEGGQAARRPRLARGAALALASAAFATLALAGLLAAALMLAAPAQAQDSGNGITPILVPGNPSCAAGETTLAIEPVADGTFTDGTLTVTIDVRDTVDGQVFDWTSNLGVDSIIVKGGPNANHYVYDPPAEGTDDTGLHSPVNVNTGRFYGLTLLSFCYDLVEPPPTCKGHVATIAAVPGQATAGTDGDDVIVGTPGADVIDAGLGDDLVCARAGADQVNGGEGADRLSGNVGADTVGGDGGADAVRGGDDGDSLSGGEGDDTVSGRAGDDSLDGNAGTNTLDGGSGTDTCVNGPVFIRCESTAGHSFTS